MTADTPSPESEDLVVAVNALADAQYGFPLCDLILSDAELESLHREARAVLSAVTPRIEAAAAKAEREACAKLEQALNSIWVRTTDERILSIIRTAIRQRGNESST